MISVEFPEDSTCEAAENAVTDDQLKKSPIRGTSRKSQQCFDVVCKFVDSNGAEEGNLGPASPASARSCCPVQNPSTIRVFRQLFVLPRSAMWEFVDIWWTQIWSP